MAYADIDAGKVLNKEGLLELSNQIKSYVDVNAGGGSSYTAGNGIDIDSNGVISAENMGFSANAIGYLVGNYYLNGLGPGAYYIKHATTKEEFIKFLKSGLFVVYKTGDSFTINGADIVPFPTQQDTLQNCFYAVNVNDNGEITNSNRYFNTSKYLISSGSHIYALFGNTIFSFYSRAGLCWMFKGIRFLAQNNSGIIATTMNSAINEVAINLNTRIPSAPTTDGDYVLKVSVSSGTPTYSWVSAT